MKDYDDMTPEEQAKWDLEEEVFEGSRVSGLANPRQLGGMLDIFERVAMERGKHVGCSWNDGSVKYGTTGKFNVPSHIGDVRVDDKDFERKMREYAREIAKEHVFSEADSKKLKDHILFLKDGLETGEVVSATCSLGEMDYLIMHCAFTKEHAKDTPKYVGTCKVDGFASGLLPRKEIVELLATDEKKEWDDMLQGMFQDIRDALGLD